MKKVVVHTEPVIIQNQRGNKIVEGTHQSYIITLDGSIIAEEKELMTRDQAYAIWGRGNVIFKK